jgi:anti-anti-sigma factor
MSKKILVIEDEPQIRENIEEILELEDFQSILAENGRIGVEMAISQLPDLIISDVMMPELDGYGVLMALREHPETVSIPFIFLTAKSAKEDRRTAMDLGADDYLTKPFTPSELISAIRTRLARQIVLTKKYARFREYAEQLPTHAATNSTSINFVPPNGDRVKLIQPTGVLDVSNCSQFRRDVNESINDGYRQILIDCQNLSFIDSSGLATLVVCFQKTREVGGYLSICSINDQIKMLLELSNLDSILPVYPDMAAAYQAFESDRSLALAAR